MTIRSARPWVRFFAIVSAAVVLSLGSGSARAGDVERATALFKEGRAAMQNGQLDVACAKFSESYALDPAPGTVMNLAVCMDKRNRLASALEAYKKVVAALREKDERVAFAKQRIAEIEPRVARLTLMLSPNAPKETTVILDGKPVPSSSIGLAQPIDAGEHVVVTSAAGRSDSRVSVTLADGESRQVLAEPSPEAGNMAAPAAAAAPPSQPQRSPDTGLAQSSGRRTLGFIIGGVGVAGVAVGAVAGVMTMQKKSVVDSECNADEVCKSTDGIDAAKAGRTLSAISTVAFAVGIAGLGVGTVLVLTGGQSKQTPTTALRASAAPDGARLGIVRQF